MFLIKVVEKIKTYFMLKHFFPPKILAFTGNIVGPEVLIFKPEGKRPLGRPRHRWEDSIKMNLQDVGGSCGDWMEVAQDRDRWRALVGTVRNLRVPKMRVIS
jgi:hypothetical protein